MEFAGALYANILLSIANISARLFAPPPEYIKPSTSAEHEHSGGNTLGEGPEAWV